MSLYTRMIAGLNEVSRLGVEYNAVKLIKGHDNWLGDAVLWVFEVTLEDADTGEVSTIYTVELEEHKELAKASDDLEKLLVNLVYPPLNMRMGTLLW